MNTNALRQKILDLAIRGKLVPQDPSDEPASVLLERIRTQKQQMVRDGKLKAKDIAGDSIIYVGDDNLHYEKFTDGSVKCIEDEIPFDLPEGWAWSRLKTISCIGTGATPLKSNTAYYQNGTIPWVTSTATNSPTITNATDFISELALQETNCRVYPIGTLIIAMYGEGKTRGQISELGIKACTNQACAAICVLYEDERFRSYLKGYLAYSYENLRDRAQGGQQPNLNQSIIADMIIPIPPVNEIEHIVTYSSLCLEHADRIIASKEAIKQYIDLIKKRILDLAIRGKLVPQDPTDEPASVLLERIRAEKETLIKQGKIKRDKKESVIFRGDDNSYYLRTGDLVESLDEWGLNSLPDSWGICYLGELCDYGNCINVDIKDIDDESWILDLEDIEKDTGKVIRKVTKSERNAASAKHQFHRGEVLYSKLRPYLNKVVLSDDEGYCTSEILPLGFDKVVIPQYARYYLMSPTFLAYAERCSYGVKMPRLGTVDGKKAIFPLPPVSEQKRIANAVNNCLSQLEMLVESLT